jgi:ABC-2 type transport system permease protein
MMNGLELYIRYLGVTARAQMQYRASMLIHAAGQFVLTLLEFAGIWVLFARFGSLRGYGLPEIALLYGMASLSFAASESLAYGFDDFARLVVTGDFDRLLLRPRSTALQVAAQDVRLLRLGRITQGCFVFGWALHALPIAWTVPRVLLLVSALVGGTCTFVALFVAQATLAFFTTQGLEITNTITYGGIETAKYPLSIYDKWFARFFTYVIPLACMNFLPAMVIIGRSNSLAGWLSPLVGPAFLGLSLKLWGFGVRHYRSVGA